MAEDHKTRNGLSPGIRPGFKDMSSIQNWVKRLKRQNFCFLNPRSYGARGSCCGPLACKSDVKSPVQIKIHGSLEDLSEPENEHQILSSC